MRWQSTDLINTLRVKVELGSQTWRELCRFHEKTAVCVAFYQDSDFFHLAAPVIHVSMKRLGAPIHETCVYEGYGLEGLGFKKKTNV